MSYIAQTQIADQVVNGFSDSSVADAVFKLGQELPAGVYTVVCYHESDVDGKVSWLGTAVHQFSGE